MQQLKQIRVIVNHFQCPLLPELRIVVLSIEDKIYIQYIYININIYIYIYKYTYSFEQLQQQELLAHFFPG